MDCNNITPDVIEVKALENYLLYLKFDTNEEKIYDMKKLIEINKFYEKLRDKKYFKNVVPRGDTVEWANGEDICPENLYNDSVCIEECNVEIKQLD